MGKSKFTPKFVLFRPTYVGWANGLREAINDAKKLNVPLAVRTRDQANRIRQMHTRVKVIVI